MALRVGAFASHREKLRPNHLGSAMQTAVAEALFISPLYNVCDARRVRLSQRDRTETASHIYLGVFPSVTLEGLPPRPPMVTAEKLGGSYGI